MTLSAAQLRRAAALQEKIETLQSELASLLGSKGSSATASGKPEKKKRVMSASARKRIAAAQKARWAKQKAAPAAAEKKSK